ncbi:LysR family transcriptional regulator [Pasteurellaceae bacterium 22721_9_1]
MTFDQIKTFLTVVEFGNISAASDSLFVTQSTISSRLQSLEQELDVCLMVRSKGIRNIELTSQGKAFVPIAQQWMSLWKDTRQLQQIQDIKTLNIGSVDLVNNFTFVPFFQRYATEHPNVKLGIHTFHSSEIHNLVESRQMDIGFVFSQMKYNDIISKPVYREQMYLICNKNSPYYDFIHPNELSVKNEIFLAWGPDFRQWHDAHWSPYEHPFITVNTGSLISRYLTKKEHWAIAPMSLVSFLRQYLDISCYRIQEPPTPRVCYQLTHRYAKPSYIETINQFEQSLQNFINSNDNICRFEPWMFESNELAKEPILF